MSANVSPVSWYGGKSRMAAWIVAMLPRHDTYIEAFGGGASVMFRKPRAKLEVYNDLDDGLVTFFRALRDQPGALQRALRLTPYARSEYERCRDTWTEVKDDLERARRWYVRTQMAFACSATQGWGYETTGAARAGTRACSFATSVESLQRFAERFRGVQIDQLCWQDCLERYDRPGAAFFLDPPYHPATRGREREHSYRHNLDHAEHEALLAAVVALRGSVLLCGYTHPLYEHHLMGAGFERHEMLRTCAVSRLSSARGTRTEVLWRRLEPGVAERLPLW